MTAGIRPAGRTLFLHVPKTGGTTLREVLVRALPVDEVVADLPDPHTTEVQRAITRRYLHGETDDRPDAGNAPILRRWAEADVDLGRARVYTAHLWYGMHEHFPEPCDYVTVLRDPVDRVRSLYRHRVSVQGIDQSPVDWIASGREPQLDNHQTRVLAGAPADRYAGPCTAGMLDDAKDHLLDRFAAVGVTERFDDSVIAILAALGRALVAVPTRNRSSAGTELGPFTPDLLRRIADANRFDQDLHRFAGARLDAALVGVDRDAARRRLRRLTREQSRRDRCYPTRERLGLLRRSLTSRLSGG